MTTFQVSPLFNKIFIESQVFADAPCGPELGTLGIVDFFQ